jgi:hypothetical protein
MMNCALWLEFIHPPPSIVRLRICAELGPYIAPALEAIIVDMEMIRKVLPELRKHLFECSRRSAAVEQFVAVCQLSSRPVIVRYAVFPCVWDDTYV